MTNKYTKDQDMIRSEETLKYDENKILRKDVASWLMNATKHGEKLKSF
jgi:hypothetical protein